MAGLAAMDFTTAALGGQKFVFADGGEGPLIVLLHGFPDTPAGWSHTRDVLVGAGYRVVVPYLRGYHPQTIVPGRKYSGQLIGEDVVHLLDAIDAESAVIVGHDWGAGLAYRAAAIAPDRVRALCAVAIPHPRTLSPSPALLWKARHFITLRLPSRRWLAAHDDFAYLDVLMRRWAPHWSGPEREQCLADVKACFSDPAVLDGALSYYHDADLRETAPMTAQPALLVGGTTDIVDVESFRRSPEAFTGPCEIVIADGAGHWPHREAADLFHEHLLAFLGGLG
jgi:pimeloyl-ACP methyl ester carboxylesterase